MALKFTSNELVEIGRRVQDARMYCREMIKRTVAYSELLAKNMGGKKA